MHQQVEGVSQNFPRLWAPTKITFFVAVVHAEPTLVHVRTFLVEEFLISASLLLSRAEESSRHAAPLQWILWPRFETNIVNRSLLSKQMLVEVAKV